MQFTYLDGNNNKYSCKGKQLEYVSMQAALSSSGTYSGGSDSVKVLTLQMLHSLKEIFDKIVEIEQKDYKRNMGSGQLHFGGKNIILPMRHPLKIALEHELEKIRMCNAIDCMDPIILENNRVRLSPLGEEHFEALLPIATEYPDLLRYSPSPFGNEDGLRAYIARAMKAKSEGIRYPFVIYDKQHQQIAGSTSFGNIANAHLRVEIGWTWITPLLQRTGLNRNNKFLMLQYAFDTLGFERVEFKSDSRNLQSRKAMEDIGARFEGELRSHMIMPDGYRRNSVYYGIIKSEWDGIKQNIFTDIKNN